MKAQTVITIPRIIDRPQHIASTLYILLLENSSLYIGLYFALFIIGTLHVLLSVVVGREIAACSRAEVDA